LSLVTNLPISSMNKPIPTPDNTAAAGRITGPANDSNSTRP
jgi:hypothetical protein